MYYLDDIRTDISLDNNNILTFWKQWIEKNETREKKKKNYCLRNNDKIKNMD